jgi:hypothetical protein
MRELFMKTRATVAITATALAAGLAIGAFTASQAQPKQGHMRSALASLTSAQAQLQVAAHNKGGHRSAALGFVRQAISEVEAGIASGDVE